MQAINENHHPIEELPNEMFSSILSFLPPSSIAHSSAASRSWRTQILSTPRLHEEVDLTKLDQDEDILPIVYHFQRLSILSLNRLTKVSLNMTPFLQDWNLKPSHKKGQRFQAFDILLTTLHQSEQTLKEITLSVNGSGPESDHGVLEFCLHLLRNLGSFTSLRTFWLEAPIPFSLSAGNSDSKTITVSNIPDKRLPSIVAWASSVMIAELMREVKTRSGSGLTEFWPNHYEEWDEEESLEIIQELWDCSSLETLDVSCLIVNQAFWDFALQSQSVRSLTINVDIVQEILQAPRGVRKAENLKELELEFQHFKVDWISISEWAGDRLEKLVLRLESESMKGLFCSAFDKSMIINSKQYLKEFYLSTERGESKDLTGAFTQENLSETKFLFPNLEKLYLEDVDAPIFHFFSNVDYPKLQNLGICENDESFARQSFDCLMKILEKADSKIIEMEVYITKICSFESPQANLNFSSLKELQFGRVEDSHQTRKSELPKWLLTSSYPNLTVIRIDGGRYEEDVKEILSKLKAEGKAPRLQL